MSSHNDDYISITVGEPIKMNDKFSSYISYKIITNSKREGFGGSDVSVTRRYSEFSWLAKELSNQFPGVIIPALPEKQAVGRFSSDFVESRQRALEKFLQRCADHPDLGFSKTFLTFLQCDEVTLSRLMTDSKAAKPKMSASAMQWFEGTVTTIQNSGKRAEVEKSAADLQVEDISTHITALEKQMQSIIKHAENLVKRYKEQGSALFELGQSFTWLGQTEGDNVGQSMIQLGATTDKVSVTTNQTASYLDVNFLEPLEEYLRFVVSVRAALAQRQEKRNSYVDAMTDLEVKQNAYNKIIGVPGKEDQASLKQQQVVKAQSTCDTAKTEFDDVTARLIKEFDDFKNQKAKDFRNIIVKFVEAQIEYHRKAEEDWNNILPTLQSTHVPSGSQKFHGSNSNPFEGSNGHEYSSFHHDDDMIGV